MNKTYDDIVNRLRDVRPTIASPEKLTNSIMANISGKIPEKKHYITLNVNDKQWSIINGIRILLSSAAVFLIGYLIYQQWETNQKLEAIQDVVLTSSQKPGNYQSNYNDLEKVYNELKVTHASYIEQNPQIEKLMIERKSLNYLLNQIRELRKENESFREKLRKKYESKNLEK